MRRKDYGADETALRKAIDHLPDELFSTYHGAWQESISLALLDAIYFLHHGGRTGSADPDPAHC